MGNPQQPAQPAQQPRGLNLRLDLAKVDAALANQPRIVVSTLDQAQNETTLLEISRAAQVNPGVVADNQVNVLC